MNLICDICQDKDSPYDIRLEEIELINAAIGLGRWLAGQKEATESQKLDIFKILNFLENLPAPPPTHLHGEFGFVFDHEDGHQGSWFVSVCRAHFEIFCCGRHDLPEFYWCLCPGSQNHNNLTWADEWISQVSEPRALALSDCTLTIEASTWTVK